MDIRQGQHFNFHENQQENISLETERYNLNS